MAEYRINYTQSNFTGGIIAAELYGRNDFNKVKTGLKKCSNWTIREAGGLEFRRGTKYLNTVPAAAGTNFKMASLDKLVLFFCSDGIRYLNSSNVWTKINYPTGVSPNLSKLQFTELKRRLYYYDGTIKLCEVTLTAGVPSTAISTFEVAPSGCSINAETIGTEPTVYVPYEHTYTFSLAKNSEEEGICSALNATGGHGDQDYWTDAASINNTTGATFTSITYDGTKFIALGYKLTLSIPISVVNYMSTSLDGRTWTELLTVYDFEDSLLEFLAYGNSKCVAINSAGWVSVSLNDDKTIWSTPTENANLGNNDWCCLCYGASKFVALSQTGYISTSPNGTSWTAATQISELSGHIWKSICYNGTNFIALDMLGYISTSTNGTTWTAPTRPLSANNTSWGCISFSGRNYLATGTSDAKFSTSSDGITWTTPQSAPFAFVAITSNDKKFIGLTSNGKTSCYVHSAASTFANVELTAANSDTDGKGQQVNVSVSLTNELATAYNGGKIYIYKLYQGFFYFLTALNISSGTTTYEYKDMGLLSPDLSKTPKENPGYIGADGSISAVNSIADYNQRLFLTRTNNNISQIVFSAVGNTSSFAYSVQRHKDEGGNLELPISNYDSWCKVTSGLDLILSTSYTISKVSGVDDLTTDTVLWDGLSKTVDPVRTRRSLIYTNTSNRNIYDLTYNEYGQYDSIDLTLLIKYIFEEKTIKRLAFKDYPVKTIYVLCSDGELYCLTYIKDQNIYAWYKIEHTGFIYDLCVVNTDTEDEVYVVVKYGSTYILEQAYHKTDNVYLDCVIKKTQSQISGNTITGLSIFEGKKVRVFDLGNNLYYGDYDIMNPKTVVEGGKTVEIDDLDFNGYLVESGSITLPDNIELKGDVLIGLPYYAVAETIPLEFSDQNGNSTIGRKKAVNEAYLRYGDSRGLTYKTMGHEYDCGVCERDIADNAQFLERGQVKLHTVSEYKWDSTIKILQRQPYPARIESITLGLTFNDKS